MNVMVEAIQLYEINGKTSITNRKIKTFSKTKQLLLRKSFSEEKRASSTSPINVFRNKRLDKFGTVIIKGQKSHRVSFADEFEIKLVHRESIESFKQFNKENNSEIDINKLSRGDCCRCLIF